MPPLSLQVARASGMSISPEALQLTSMHTALLGVAVTQPLVAAASEEGQLDSAPRTPRASASQRPSTPRSKRTRDSDDDDDDGVRERKPMLFDHFGATKRRISIG